MVEKYSVIRFVRDLCNPSYLTTIIAIDLSSGWGVK